MDSFWRFFHALQAAAIPLRGTLFAFFIPVIMVLGIGTLASLGIRGIATKETIVIARRAQRSFKITGTAAVVLGIVYLALAAVFVPILGSFSFVLWF